MVVLGKFGGVVFSACSKAHQGEPLLSTFPSGCDPFPSRFIYTTPHGSGGLSLVLHAHDLKSRSKQGM